MPKNSRATRWLSIAACAAIAIAAYCWTAQAIMAESRTPHVDYSTPPTVLKRTNGHKATLPSESQFEGLDAFATISPAGHPEPMAAFLTEHIKRMGGHAAIRPGQGRNHSTIEAVLEPREAESITELEGADAEEQQIWIQEQAQRTPPPTITADPTEWVRQAQPVFAPIPPRIHGNIHIRHTSTRIWGITIRVKNAKLAGLVAVAIGSLAAGTAIMGSAITLGESLNAADHGRQTQ